MRDRIIHHRPTSAVDGGAVAADEASSIIRTKGPNGRSASTTWAWRRVKIASPAGGQRDSAPKALRWRHLSRWDRRRPLTITVKYRGGEECWYEVRARGSMGRFPGVVAIHDVIDEVMRGADRS